MRWQDIAGAGPRGRVMPGRRIGDRRVRDAVERLERERRKSSYRLRQLRRSSRRL